MTEKLPAPCEACRATDYATEAHAASVKAKAIVCLLMALRRPREKTNRSDGNARIRRTIGIRPLNATKQYEDHCNAESRKSLLVTADLHIC